MAFYLFLAERHGSGVGSRWALMGLAVRLGISVRIHLSAHSIQLIDGLQMGLRTWNIGREGQF